MNPTFTTMHTKAGSLASGLGSFSFNIRSLDPQRYGDKQNQDGNNNYRLIFLTSGHAEYYLDKQKVTLDPSFIGIIKPNQLLSNLSCKGADGCILSFSSEYLHLTVISSQLIQKLQLGISGMEKVPVPTSDRLFLTDVCKRLIEEFDFRNGLQDEVIRGLFQVFTVYLARATAKIQPMVEAKCNRYTQRFFALLDQHFTTLKMPADYADLLAVTPAYLNIIIKESLGYTTSYFIQQRILTEAKRLMMSEEMNMKEVAYKLGFFDVSHFSKFFKRISGARFTDFKKSLAA